ncbi:Dam family site-specific DNA-(adenine-N6)-methyltransferase, partial [Limosilactobacillus fermentum]
SGDIAYIDTPYTVTQYISAYHMLETIAKYDYPTIKGVGGKRERGDKNSLYARKKTVKEQFEDLFRQLQFKYIIVSYSNQGLLDLKELVELAKIFAVHGEVHIEKQSYTEYQNHRSSNKRNGKELNEVLIVFEKDININKSPLNYSGSKNTLVPIINRELPKHVETFVDAMGGAFNVGANIVATDKVIYNEINTYVYDLISWILNTSKSNQIKSTQKIIGEYGLSKKNKEAYLALRNDFNANYEVQKLFVLHLYSFQNMIRFNSKLKFNTPVGVAGYSDDLKNRQLNFIPKTENIELINGSYANLKISKMNKNTVFYFDPPYNITKASYNDGKRGFGGWSDDDEIKLLNFLDLIDNNGQKFILSNVIKHKDKVNFSHYYLLGLRNLKV